MMARMPLIAGNWKMYKTVPEAVETAGALVRRLADYDESAQVMIAPPFTALAALSPVLGKSPVALGAQNLFWEKEGAFTGEISGPMLVSAGCRFVIIGHSERRQYFGEIDETVRKRVRSALEAGLIPVVCIGETESQRDAGETFSILDKQLSNGLKSMVLSDPEKWVVAYEPVWAIGTGKTATSAQAQEVHAFIREWVAKAVGQTTAEGLRILYGGSVKPGNIAELMAMPDVDGALVGGASLEPETFEKIIRYQTKS